MSPYERLAQLAELALAAAGAGDLDELARLDAERDALAADLPAVPPPNAAAPLRRAIAAELALRISLHTDLALARERLGALQGGRRAARGYAPAPVAAAVDRTG
jgi:hypothetical protein